MFRRFGRSEAVASRTSRRFVLGVRALGLGVLGALSAQAIAHAQAPWQYAGGDLANTHAHLSDAATASSASQLNPSTIGRLAVKWTFATSGDISATPTVEPGGLYVPDWGGMLYKLDPATGAQIWAHAVCDYTSSCYTANASIARTSPAIGASVIVIGDEMAHYDRADYGALVIGVDKATGAKLWTTNVNNTSKYASVLSSPTVYNGIAYVGTASWEEGIAGTDPTYKPVFRGNVTALNVNTGAIIWQFTTVPAGYSGGPVPGSHMAVWTPNNALMFGTGNNYSVPASAASCVAAAGASTPAQKACFDPTNYIDALMSVDLNTGKLIWARRVTGADTWTEACYYNNAACPQPEGTDSDFAQSPLVTYVPNFTGVSDDRAGTSQNWLMGAGRKSSEWYAVNPYNGGLYWSTMIGTGGMEWGSTVNIDDFNSIYVALHNPDHVSQTIGGINNANPHTWNAGAWEALDIRTGKSQWMVQTVGQDLANPAFGGAAPGCMTFTNRVLFAGATSGYFVAMDANSGTKLWYYNSGGTVVSCPAIFNETVYWGTGYARHGVAQHLLYAFAVP